MYNRKPPTRKPGVYSNEAALQQAFNGALPRPCFQPALWFLPQLHHDRNARAALQTSPRSHGLPGIFPDWYTIITMRSQCSNCSILSGGKLCRTVLAANVFLSKIDDSIAGRIVSEPNGKLLKGEALAIRAMLHFDMLEIVRSVYASGNGNKAIPSLHDCRWKNATIVYRR